MAESESAAHGIVTPAGDVSQEGCSGGCSICDLLEQYHSATAAASTPPLFFAQLAQQTIEVDRVDANVTTRLAESRGPPVAARI